MTLIHIAVQLLTFNLLDKIVAGNILLCFLCFPENWAWHFMQIVSKGNVKLSFLGKFILESPSKIVGDYTSFYYFYSKIPLLTLVLLNLSCYAHL